jgi:hypothetical protein
MNNLKKFEDYIYMGSKPDKKKIFVEIFYEKPGHQLYSSVHDAVFFKFDTEEDAEKFVEDVKAKGEYNGSKVKYVRAVTNKYYKKIKKYKI